jgi:hypothetical protein
MMMVHVPRHAAALTSMLSLLLALLCLIGCGGSPYRDTAVNAADLEGKDKVWFERNWGKPNGKAKRFFGGEAWTYFRITGERVGSSVFNFAPNQCQITLKFDRDDRLRSSEYSGC